ncbi:MAG: twin-arginine translocation signal domain-containing protein [Granulosicoccus sp.]
MSDKQEVKTKKPAFINANRRGFLQGAAVAGGVAATGVAAAADSVDVPVDQMAKTVEGKGYELTDHVRKYYKRARF